MTFGGDILFAAWLDLREKGTRLFGSVSRDGGASWSTNRLVYASPSGTVCQCCHPSVAVTASGAILVMFRNALDGSRDLYLTRSEDGGRTFTPARKLGRGTWTLDVCPMDGGAVAVGEGGGAATVWRREQTVFATEGDAPERAMGPGRNPTAVLATGGLYAAWTQGTAVVVSKPGRDSPEVVADAGAFPSLAPLADGSVLAAWESSGAIAIRTLR